MKTWETETKQAEQDWNLMLVATSGKRPAGVLEGLSGAILACGGWVLRQGQVSDVCADLDFEFPRVHAMEIYSVLMAAGVELSLEAHQQLTALCHCTGHLQSGDAFAAVRVQLTLYAEEAAGSFLASLADSIKEAA